MTRADLLAKMRDIRDRGGKDPERDHSDLDDLLLEYINDPVVTKVFERVEKWYA